MQRGWVILSHGLESGPEATKVSALAEVAAQQGWSSLRADYRDLGTGLAPATIEARIQRLLGLAASRRPLCLAGSSLGAFVSARASLRVPVQGLFLIAPPVAIPGSAPLDCAEVPLWIVHGWDDELIDVAGVVDFARRRRARTLLLDGDHRLGAQLAEIRAAFAAFLSTVGGS